MDQPTIEAGPIYGAKQYHLLFTSNFI